MADPKIRIRRSSTPNKVPNITQLELGELAINTYDGKIYLEQDQGAAGVGNTVVRINPWNVGLGTTAYNISFESCLLYTSPSPRDLSTSRMPSSA